MKMYAWTMISCFALPSSRTTASVAPPRGEKKTSVTCAAKGPAVTEEDREEQAKVNVSRKAMKRNMRERGISIIEAQELDMHICLDC